MFSVHTLKLDAPAATFVAALVAALASLLTLLLKVVFDRNSESRNTYRQSLAPIIEELGSALHMIVAASVLSLKDTKSEDRNYWNDRASAGRKSLRNIRSKVRYPLWGIDQAIRAMSYLPSWVASNKVVDKGALIVSATNLRRALDSSIRRCYRYGRPPSLPERWYIAYRLGQLESHWSQNESSAESIADAESTPRVLHSKTYATIIGLEGQEFLAAGDDGNTYRVRINNKSGKGHRADAQPGKRIKLYKRGGEDFFRYRFGGG